MKNFLDEVFEGLDITTSPATNAGDPLAKADTKIISVQDEIYMLFDEEKELEKEDISMSEEAKKDITECLEYFKDDNSFEELSSIIKQITDNNSLKDK